jgi:hypothetical protein
MNMSSLLGLMKVATLCLFTMHVSAGKVDQTTAAKVAVNFYFRQYNISSVIQYGKISVSTSFIKKSGQVSAYYVFNISKGGFVMVSACDAAYPVPSYSFEGEYKPDDEPPQFSDWVKQYENQIVMAVQEKMKQSEEVKRMWEELLTDNPAELIIRKNIRSVTPMINTHWDQGLHYNELCPPDAAGPGGHTIAGCVPVAMAQVMNYYRWPEQGTGTYSYNDTVYGTISADFGNTLYNWDEMPVESTTENHALAELLFHLGVSVDLHYGPDGSGMTNHKAAYSLKTYFKYSPNTQYIFRDSTTINWKQTLIDHLDAGMPLYYAGWSDTVFQDGHAFVCDGYQDTMYFHFNWGWSGAYDGYFMVDDLTPGSYHFTLLHEMIAYMFPEGDYPVFCDGNKTLASIEGIIDDGSGPLNYYTNNSDCSWLVAPNDSLAGISLEFIRFSLDTSDFVIVYDGESTTSPVLGIFTGNILPQTVSATGNRMLVIFSSDASGTNDGFLASYTSEPVVFCHGTTTITDNSGTIEDGSGNYLYRNNVLCIWKIEPPDATSFTVYYDNIDLADEDYLKVYSSNNLLAFITGDTLPPPLTVEGSNLKVTFKSNLFGTAQGFKLHYQTETSGISYIDPGGTCILYPNPSSGFIHISVLTGTAMPYEIMLFDATGRLMEKQTARCDEYDMDIEKQPKGMYFIKINHPEFFVVKKVVKMQ